MTKSDGVKLRKGNISWISVLPPNQPVFWFFFPRDIMESFRARLSRALDVRLQDNTLHWQEVMLMI